MQWLKSRLNTIRKLPRTRRLDARINLRGPEVSEQIARGIASGAPFFVGRFGSTEIDALVQFERVLAGAAWKEEAFHYLKLDSGVYPLERPVLERFHALYLDAMAKLDVLGSWCLEELDFASRLDQTRRAPLADLEPYFHDKPWSAALAGKRVLVVHPMVRTIERQYRNHRTRIHANPDVLPEFELSTVEAIQCFDGSPDYPDWHRAYEVMKERIEAQDFDVAILGCGAFGFPLAAHIKSMGKQAIHLGGATQILFGIIGKRWEDIPEVASRFNEFWCRPQEDEKPANAQQVENGAYW